jgi:hypothetical protein
VNSRRWVLLLGPRQHGKTSALRRLCNELKDNGFRSVYLDLQSLPPLASYSELLRWIDGQLRNQLGLPLSVVDSELELLDELLISIFGGIEGQIVIIIDEAAAITNSEFRNSFYGQIRAIKNSERKSDSKSVEARLIFIFSGTFRPENLVHTENSPFNVCERILTDDLTLEQAKELVANTHSAFLDLVPAAYSLVGGQPYLLQTIFFTLERRIQDAASADACLSEILEEFPGLVGSHLSGIFSKIIGSPSLLKIVVHLLRDGGINSSPADQDEGYLEVMGFIKRTGRTLNVRNKLYLEVAQQSRQLADNPSETPSVAQSHPQLFKFNEEDLDFMQNPSLKDFCYASQFGAIKAFRVESYRLAVVAVGSAVEALLMDALLQVPVAARNAAINNARCNWTRYNDQADPVSWSLNQLVDVTKQLVTSVRSFELHDYLRDWRNMIHPAVAIQQNLTEPELQHHAMNAISAFSILLIGMKKYLATLNP